MPLELEAGAVELTIADEFYPERAAGGFSHVSSTVDFYNHVNALLEPEMVLVDFGAGRGGEAEVPSRYVRELTNLRGKVRKVIGVDVDPVVHDNPLIDEAVLINPATPLPFADASIDMIVTSWTFEHIEDPKFIVGELGRVLRPGGWLCARTPNRWGYITLGARLVPAGLHAAVLRRVQPDRKDCDVFPKFYRLNSVNTIKREFERFDVYLYTVNSEPAYFGNSRLLWRAALLGFRLTPSRFGAVIHAFMKKKSET
jgi:SAM-dependent methyltransferase